jgi:probable F420-dependent oxidoreductase
MSSRPFRFGVVAAHATSGADWIAKAQRIEALGYSTLLVPDVLRFGYTPFAALAAAASVTKALRLGTYVIANDMRHPVLLAKDVVTLVALSHGRLELGMGAGRHTAAEDNRMLGLSFDSGGVRLARLAESVSIVKRLLAGETVTASSRYYTLENARVSQRPLEVPLMLAGSGPRLLQLAATEANIVALGLAPTDTEATAAQLVDRLRASPRFAELELHVNLMAVGDRVPRFIASQMGLDAATLARSNAATAVVGSVESMCDQLESRREHLGISYFATSDELMEDLAPVVERLAGA